MASDTEADVGKSSRAHPSNGAPPVDSLSECADTLTVEEIRELACVFEELSVPESSHLPDGVVKIIASHLVKEPASLFYLLSLCGTCSHWRRVGRELTSGVCLSYDGFDNVFSNQPSIQRFKKLNQAAKEEVFTAAAKLFEGYTEVNFSGDGVSDAVLLRVSENVGNQLVKCRLQNSATATDVGLHRLMSTASSLSHLHLEDLNKVVTGQFLADIFEQCTSLQTLHLSSMPIVSWGPCKISSAGWTNRSTITKLHVRGVNLDPEFGIILTKLPNLVDLEIDGPARNISSASYSCPNLQRVSYQVASRPQLDEALSALVNLPKLKGLELIIKNFTLCSDQLRVIGMLPLIELRLDSYIYKQQPTLSRSSYSHVDNDGVKALVDSICNRWCVAASEMQPLKLSLCGATALTHDAVSALLRLPILTELDIGGCCRIIAMDKMRLVAKVRAGREMLESGRRPNIRNSRFPGLFL